MNEIKVPRWRYLSLLFVALAATGFAADCVYKMALPFRNLAMLILPNAAFAVVVVAAVFIGEWDRSRGKDGGYAQNSAPR